MLYIARQFLSRVLPWAPVGDPNAYFNLHWKFIKQGEVDTMWTGRAAQTMDDMINNLQFAIKSKSTTDIYVCLSSQRMATQKVSQYNGRSYTQAVRSASNAVHLRSLFIDIDVKEGGYPDTGSAINALIGFCNASGMPQPTLAVSSGTGGLHVYWCMDQALPVQDWLPMARALVEATRKHGLIIDSACTIDAARILRVPETHNYKVEPPALVTIASGAPLDFDYPVAQLREVLAPYTPSNVQQFTGASVTSGAGLQFLDGAAAIAPLFKQTQTVDANADLTGGLASREARPVVLDTVATQCGFVRGALETGGAGFAQPLWNLSVLLSTFAEDGRAQAHRMSKGHTGYSPHDTDALYDRKARERVDRDLGWPSCQSIRDAGCSSCDTCPLFALRKSPLNIGISSATPAAMSNDKFPAGYLESPDGHIAKLVTRADGSVDTMAVSSYAFRDGSLQLNPTPTLFFSTTLGVTGEHRIALPVEMIGVKDGLTKHMARQGFIISMNELRSIQEFMMSWVKHLQSVKHGVTSTAPWGWNTGSNGKLSGFSYDGLVFGPAGEEPAATGDMVTSRQYTPCGTLDPWLIASKIITDQKRPALDAILASAFAAPLMAFTGEAGAIMSAYSMESGIGKSTALMVAQAVWGNPVTGKQDLNDTANSVIRKISQLQSLPLYWDELKTGDEVKGLTNFVFQIAQGKEKSRLDAGSNQRDPGSWKTLVTVASNDSLLGYIASATKSTTAGVNRILEFVVEPPVPGVGPQLAPSDVARAVKRLETNFGNAGRIYAEYIGKNHVLIDGLVSKLQGQLHERLNTTREERFWVAAIAALVVGANLANKLGLATINEHALLAFLAKTLDRLRHIRTDTSNDLSKADSIADILAQFLSEKRARNTILVNQCQMPVGKPVPVRIMSDVTKLDTLQVQVSIDDKILRIAYTALFDWLHRTGHSSPTNFINALKQQWGARRVRCTLGAGTTLSAGQTACLEIFIGSPIVETYLGDLITITAQPQMAAQ